MRAIQTKTTKFGDGTLGVESCWQLSEKELEEIIENKRIYFCCLAPTHAPASLNVVSVLDPRFSEFDFIEEQK